MSSENTQNPQEETSANTLVPHSLWDDPEAMRGLIIWLLREYHPDGLVISRQELLDDAEFYGRWLVTATRGDGYAYYRAEPPPLPTEDINDYYGLVDSHIDDAYHVADAFLGYGINQQEFSDVVEQYLAGYTAQDVWPFRK